MRRFAPLSAGLTTLLLLLLPRSANAQWLSTFTNAVSGPLQPYFGVGSGPWALNNIAIFLVTQLSNLTYIAALYMVVRSGIKLINSQEEDKLSKAKRAIGASLVAVMLAYLTPRLVEAIYTAGGIGGVALNPAAATAGAFILSNEVYGLIRWVLVIVAPLTIGVIVVTGLLAIAHFGSDEGVKKMRQATIGAITGILILMAGQAIKATFGVPDFGTPGAPSTLPIVARTVEILNQLLLLTTIAAAAMLLYAGVQLILNFGNEEGYSKAKTLLVRVVVGLVIMLISYLLSSFVMGLII